MISWLFDPTDANLGWPRTVMSRRLQDITITRLLGIENPLFVNQQPRFQPHCQNCSSVLKLRIEEFFFSVRLWNVWIMHTDCTWHSASLSFLLNITFKNLLLIFDNYSFFLCLLRSWFRGEACSRHAVYNRQTTGWYAHLRPQLHTQIHTYNHLHQSPLVWCSHSWHDCWCIFHIFITKKSYVVATRVCSVSLISRVTGKVTHHLSSAHLGHMRAASAHPHSAFTSWKTP